MLTYGIAIGQIFCDLQTCLHLTYGIFHAIRKKNVISF